MAEINLSLNNGYKWIEAVCGEKKVYVKGFYLFDNCIYRGTDFAQYILTLTIDDLKSQISVADGQFAIVLCESNSVHAFVDHMRSFPMFFWKISGGYMVSDNISLEMWTERNIEPNHKEVFLNAMFTFQETTLLEGVSQIPAGGYLSIVNEEENLGRYWEFHYAEKQITKKSEAHNVLIQGYTRLFALCEYLIQGKTVVIPLSGGYDSRLILNGLISSGVSKDKIITFTYGDENAEDAKLSKRIADAVNVRHYLVDYNTNDAREFFASEFQSFACYASQANTTPCIQEWFAVNQLKKKGIINSDCIFMPGYGGVLPGHYVREWFLTDEDISEKMQRELAETFLSNVPRGNVEKSYSLAQEIINSPYFNEYKKKRTNRNLIQCYEWFIYAEEQAKFIQNATRDYEVVGCEWITPFFFKEQYNVWAQIDNSLRLHNKAFLSCMDDYFVEELKSIPFTGSKVNAKRNKKNLIQKILYLLFFPWKNHYLYYMFPYKVYIKNAVRNMAEGLNYFVGCEVLQQLGKRR